MAYFVSHFTPARAICAIAALVVTPSSATADLTPTDVWNSFQSQLAIYGALDANETQSGDTLSVSDIKMTSTIEGATSTIALTGTLAFRALADGRVAVEMPADLKANLVTSTPNGPSTTMDLNLAQEGMAITATGNPGAVEFDFVAPSMTYSMANLIVDGLPVAADVVAALTGTAGSWTSEGTAANRQQARYTIDAMTLQGALTNPKSTDKGAFNASFGNLAVTSDSTIPEGFADLPPENIFSSGFSVDADMTFGPVTYMVEVSSKGQTTQVQGTIADGSFDLGMNGDRIRYATQTNTLDMSTAIAGLPFPPVEVHFDTSRFDLSVPVGTSETAQDFGLGVGLKGLTVSDFLWAMIDPAQQLPRGPADVVMDVSGSGNWLVDIFDPAAMGSAEVPGKLETLDLDALEVNVAGASLTGNGGFTFDNSDLRTFNGFPRPAGAIDLALTGGITLLDKLTAMQLVPQQQAMGFKMMAGLFAKPGPTPDSLTTRIEIDPSGAIFANGQKIQ